MNPQRIVIIGAALAGATAAVTLRDEGFDGEIQLIGAERSCRTTAHRSPRPTCAVRSAWRTSW
jgi:NADPH-dependent 2,4-dienoyl-CoA reductase/sulfur reductase-like enzyme